MNIAIIGYGRMGHEIEEAAVARGHTTGLTIDINNTGDFVPEKFKGIDVAIEFTSPETAFENVSRCLGMKVPVVSGTTGWQKDYDRAAELCLKHGTAFLHTSNFSIGVNLLFRLNEELASRIKDFSDYSVSIEEIHHTKKLDAPSGTAISIAKGISGNHPRYESWCNAGEEKPGQIPIKAVREGMVPGTHIITWDSPIDILSVRHEAKNRKGFALGAVVAAEYIYNRSGVYTMKDVLGF